MGMHQIFCIRTKRCASEKLLWMFLGVMWLFSLSSIFIDATPVQIIKVEPFNSNKIDNIDLPKNQNETILHSLLKVKIANSNGLPIDNLFIYPTFSIKSCDYTSEPLPIVFKNETDIVLSISDVKGHTDAYLCYRAEKEREFHHMGLVSKFVNKR